MWALDTDVPGVAWLNPPKHETITVAIAGLRGSPTLTTLSTTLGCVDSSAALHQPTPDVKADFPVFPAVSCGSFIDQAEDRLRNLVFHATAVRVSDYRLIFGNTHEQLVLDRAIESPTAATTVDPQWMNARRDRGIGPGLGCRPRRRAVACQGLCDLRLRHLRGSRCVGSCHQRDPARVAAVVPSP